jgi:hypothetical protein
VGGAEAILKVASVLLDLVFLQQLQCSLGSGLNLVKHNMHLSNGLQSVFFQAIFMGHQIGKLFAIE